jgi:anti-sigma B factor antagonist
MNLNGKLTISHSHEEMEGHTLELAGDLDVQTAPLLQRFIDRMIVEGKINLTLDLSRLSYLDSSGYGAIIDAGRRTKATSGKLDLANLPAWMSEFFDLTMLESSFGIESREKQEEATV